STAGQAEVCGQCSWKDSPLQVESSSGGRKSTGPLHAMASSGSVCSAERSQLQDSSESDSETEGGPARLAGVEPSPGSFARTQVIHSGHFMVSSPHSDSAARRRKSGGSLRYDFDTVNRTWCQTYRYHSGSLSIDPTLTRLFECMSLAYRWVLQAGHGTG
ncbi:hypothetical protein XENOCAPTIV_023179, partial [Xenoophorus captivus]